MRSRVLSKSFSGQICYVAHLSNNEDDNAKKIEFGDMR